MRKLVGRQKLRRSLPVRCQHARKQLCFRGHGRETRVFSRTVSIRRSGTGLVNGPWRFCRWLVEILKVAPLPDGTRDSSPVEAQAEPFLPVLATTLPEASPVVQRSRGDPAALARSPVTALDPRCLLPRSSIWRALGKEIRQAPAAASANRGR